MPEDTPELPQAWVVCQRNIYSSESEDIFHFCGRSPVTIHVAEETAQADCRRRNALRIRDASNDAFETLSQYEAWRIAGPKHSLWPALVGRVGMTRALRLLRQRLQPGETDFRPTRDALCGLDFSGLSIEEMESLLDHIEFAPYTVERVGVVVPPADPGETDPAPEPDQNVLILTREGKDIAAFSESNNEDLFYRFEGAIETRPEIEDMTLLSWAQVIQRYGYSSENRLVWLNLDDFLDNDMSPQDFFRKMDGILDEIGATHV